jgi:SAM-dependent methyltransferase
MRECSKSIVRRLNDSNFVRKYFVGIGVDVGGKPDPLVLYKHLFPLMESVRTWDWEDGDAEFMEGVADNTFDFLFASHCLEHLRDPHVGIRNWLRIVKPGGHLIVNVPEEDLYEQGIFPSTYNRDHKHTWTMGKEVSWSPNSINVVEFVQTLGPAADVRKLEIIDATYRYDLPRIDQTLAPVAECAIEIIIRKRTDAEIVKGGRVQWGGQPKPEVRLHFNQYMDDQVTLRSANKDKPPFKNDSELEVRDKGRETNSFVSGASTGSNPLLGA